MSVSILVALGVVCLVSQLAVLRGIGHRRPIGDENDYLERGRSDDPYAPRLFLRPPILPWLAAFWLRGDRPDAQRRLRLSLALVSFLTVIATAVAGWRLGGAEVAILAALLLTVQPERVLLACHVWPDTLLAFALASLAVVLTLPATPEVALLAGLCCTAGVLIRIDFVAALPLVTAAWWTGHGALPAVVVVALVGPPAVALAVLTIVNARRYGIALPDNTWAFNLMVAQTETRFDTADRFTIDGMVTRTVAAWRELSPAETPRRGLEALWRSLRPPIQFARAVARRLLTMVGPDTFVRMKLLPREQSYGDLGERSRSWWRAVLVPAFPALISVVLVAAIVGGGLPASFAWPSLGLAATMVLFHARTRFRVALLPALCLVAAHELVRFGDLAAIRPLSAALIVAGVAALTWALVQIRCSAEL